MKCQGTLSFAGRHFYFKPRTTQSPVFGKPIQKEANLNGRTHCVVSSTATSTAPVTGGCEKATKKESSQLLYFRGDFRHPKASALDM